MYRIVFYTFIQQLFINNKGILRKHHLCNFEYFQMKYVNPSHVESCLQQDGSDDIKCALQKNSDLLPAIYEGIAIIFISS